MTSEPMVHIVDDDEAIRDALSLLLDTVGTQNKTYENAQVFLQAYQQGDLGSPTGCIIMDIRMPIIGGMECQQQLQSLGCDLPLIFITGHGDVPMAVEAMKRGAAEFIQKPFREQELLDAIQRAINSHQQVQQDNAHLQTLKQRLASLTPREQEVLQAIVEGKANKVTAIDLNLSQRTVEIHRARVMEKMQAKSLAALVTMMVELDRGQ